MKRDTTVDLPWHSSLVIGSLLFPLALQVVLYAAAVRFANWVPWYGNFMSETICCGAGLLFLVTKYRWKAFLIGIAYIPAMFVMLVCLAFVMTAVMFGNVQ